MEILLSLKNLKFLKLLLLLLVTQDCHGVPFFNDHARGWHWYDECFALRNQEKQPDPSREASPSSKSPTDQVKAYREELEKRLHAAWVYPTPQNLQAYQEMQKDLMNRSKIFASVWIQNVFQHPELDHTLISPVNQQARHLHIDLEKEHIRKTIQSLSETFGLFFFFASDCPYCHQFAPIVKHFAKTYGWEVIAISVDGGRLEEFPNAEVDNGLFQAWGIKVLPSLYAVNPKTQEAIPIAYGLTSLDEIEQRLGVLTHSGARHQGPGVRKNSQIQRLIR